MVGSDQINVGILEAERSTAKDKLPLCTVLHCDEAAPRPTGFEFGCADAGEAIGAIDWECRGFTNTDWTVNTAASCGAIGRLESASFQEEGCSVAAENSVTWADNGNRVADIAGSEGADEGERGENRFEHDGLQFVMESEEVIL